MQGEKQDKIYSICSKTDMVTHQELNFKLSGSIPHIKRVLQREEVISFIFEKDMVQLIIMGLLLS